MEDFVVFVTPSGAFGGISLDGGETVFNRVGRNVPTPDGFCEIAPEHAPPMPAATESAFKAFVDAVDRSAAGKAEREAAERSAAEASAKAGREAVERKREAYRAFVASPEGKASAERDIAILRNVVKAIESATPEEVFQAFVGVSGYPKK
jgi:hypothetical protein